MSLELLGRIHKELSMTGSAFYETILALSERVNRKAQIIRLHWHASMLLEQMDQVAGDLGRQIVEQLSFQNLTRSQSDSGVCALDAAVTLDAPLNEAADCVRELKLSLRKIDAQIRELKLETIHQNLLRLQHDLSLRSAGIERITVSRRASAVGQPLKSLPRPPSVKIAVVIRGPMVLDPDENLILRPEDIVVLIGDQAGLDQLAASLAGPGSASAASTLA